MGFYAVGVSVSGFSAHVQDLQINARSYSIKWICCRSIRVNNLSGPIPSFLGNITTLGYLYALIVSFFLTCHIDSKIMLCFHLVYPALIYKNIMCSGALTTICSLELFPMSLESWLTWRICELFFFFFLINV